MNTEERDQMINALNTIAQIVCTQSELAQEIGVSSSTISNWRNRDNHGIDGKYGINKAVLADTETEIFKGLARIGAGQTLYLRAEIPRISEEYTRDGGTRSYTLSLNSTSVKAVVSALRAFGVIERSAEEDQIVKVLLFVLESDELDCDIARAAAEKLASDPVSLAQRAVAALASGMVAKAPPKPPKK